MSGERYRIPGDRDYVYIVGLFVFAFTRCEWQVAHCSERVKAGSLRKITREEMTSGQIAKLFSNLVRNMPRSKERDDLQLHAKEFLRLVSIRNRIVHGKPCTSPDGEQRLSSSGIIEPEFIEKVTGEVAACASALNAAYYGFLQNHSGL